MKIFTIAGREFEFKDLTIDESEEVTKITTKAQVSLKEYKADFTGAETKRFLYLVLKTVDNKPVDEQFFGQTLEKDFVDIFLTFFLTKMISMISSSIKFAQSTKNSIAQLENSKV